MNTKEILQKLSDVFSPKVTETQLSEIETKEEVVIESEVELAEDNKEADAPVVEAAPAVEYATKLELEEMKRTFLQILEAWQKEAETKKEVPQELSSDVDVELASDVEEISHSPELEVEKKFDLHKPKSNANKTIQSTVYSKLFN